MTMFVGIAHLSTPAAASCCYSFTHQNLQGSVQKNRNDKVVAAGPDSSNNVLPIFSLSLNISSPIANNTPSDRSYHATIAFPNNYAVSATPVGCSQVNSHAVNCTSIGISQLALNFPSITLSSGKANTNFVPKLEGVVFNGEKCGMQNSCPAALAVLPSTSGTVSVQPTQTGTADGNSSATGPNMILIMGLAAATVISTLVAGICIFLYLRRIRQEGKPGYSMLLASQRRGDPETGARSINGSLRSGHSYGAGTLYSISPPIIAPPAPASSVPTKPLAPPKPLALARPVAPTKPPAIAPRGLESHIATTRRAAALLDVTPIDNPKLREPKLVIRRDSVLSYCHEVEQESDEMDRKEQQESNDAAAVAADDQPLKQPTAATDDQPLQQPTSASKAPRPVKHYSWMATPATSRDSMARTDTKATRKGFFKLDQPDESASTTTAPSNQQDHLQILTSSVQEDRPLSRFSLAFSNSRLSKTLSAIKLQPPKSAYLSATPSKRVHRTSGSLVTTVRPEHHQQHLEQSQPKDPNAEDENECPEQQIFDVLSFIDAFMNPGAPPLPPTPAQPASSSSSSAAPATTVSRRANSKKRQKSVRRVPTGRKATVTATVAATATATATATAAPTAKAAPPSKAMPTVIEQPETTTTATLEVPGTQEAATTKPETIETIKTTETAETTETKATKATTITKTVSVQRPKKRLELPVHTRPGHHNSGLYGYL
ncbi:hypothetical protein BX616_002338 [Lobosporangium transversale]|uniref:Uncharacterized protein n=1 Tax=Lobosporangium transversale TaxID=64571 RepID=A0A1Y2H2F6_9FUNG|nr:hypothetical protein BCR41DRAFT_391156 [Lobosporangium transversale]KAF9901203.1 hypothetical protein BX616_002338 [Lobosporangium transversale]ORZ28715.1 hypothetical protein BCR41DRAFT_391156 [Lobosporangium transversale]|eukprot:XP_021886388.1 hypothetical protein BCR41DRAFT_391156 [Lobosporangium transversale]